MPGAEDTVPALLIGSTGALETRVRTLPPPNGAVPPPPGLPRPPLAELAEQVPRSADVPDEAVSQPP